MKVNLVSFCGWVLRFYRTESRSYLAVVRQGQGIVWYVKF